MPPAKTLRNICRSVFRSPAERAVLNIALEKYRPGQSDPILVGGRDLLKPALRLMSVYRIKIEEVDDTGVAMIYTRWIESVQVRGENQNVFVTLTPRFKRLWQRAKKRLPNDINEDSAHIGLRIGALTFSIKTQAIAKKSNSPTVDVGS